MADEVFMGLTALPLHFYFYFYFSDGHNSGKAICSSFNLAGKAIRYHKYQIRFLLSLSF